MQVNSNVVNRYYTSYQTNKNVKYCAGFSQTEDGKLIPNETIENPGFAEFVDYQEFHKAWMSQGAETAFSYTRNEGFNAETNSISLVAGMSARLRNGFELAIGDYMVQALGDFRDNQAASESAAIAGALSHLIKVANGQIPMNMFYSKNQDNSAYAKIGLQAFGIDTSRPFTINGKTFHFDSDEQIRLGGGQKVNSDYQTNNMSSGTEPVYAKQTGAVSVAETEDEAEIGIDFSGFAPNAPDEVRQAFMEAAEATGYYEYSGNAKMNHISQLLVRQIENRQNGVANYTDVFGSTIASALQSAREILYDLENPLMPISRRGENAAKYIEQEKEFYLSFIDKLETLQESTGGNITAEIASEDPAENLDYTQEINILTSEATMCTYPASNTDEEDVRYITSYTEEGIFCRKAGQTEGYEWTVPFENKEQYEKVMDFINQFPTDYNFRFAAHENFWTDYLNGKIDEEAFLNFMEGTDKGVPDYAIIRGDSVFVDTEKMKWAPYLNPLDAKFYTAEEFQRMQMELVEANAAKLPKITDSFEEQYRKTHPGYNGERIFRFENSNKLYNLDEIPILMYQKFLQESGYNMEQ